MLLFSFPRRCANCFGATFLLVMVWKFILLLGTAQPIPANDAFGYDGAVVNYLLHGQYCNPSLIIPFPISATHTYSIYPPFYPALLCLWMSVFGTGVLSPMWFHFVLFGLYGLTLLAIFRRLQTPAWAVNLACLFLLGITFDDRPDGLAQLLGMLAIYGWVRWLAGSGATGLPPSPPFAKWGRGQGRGGADIVSQPKQSEAVLGYARATMSPWAWLAALAVVLACCTNPELGGLYFGWVWLLVLGAVLTRQSRFPLLPMAFMTLAPVALVAYVKYARPELWAGFLEHATQTPSLTNWRLPSVSDLLKTARSIPGILLIAGICLCHWRRGAFPRPVSGDGPTDARPVIVLVTGFLITLGLVAGGLFRFTANWILFLNYIQPLLVGVFLTLELRSAAPPRRWLVPALAVMVVIVSIRAIGLSTWGVACALDRSQAASWQIVNAELNRLPPGATVVMSTAYLYDAQKHPDLHYIHEDWTHRADAPSGNLNPDTAGILKLKPAALILTQFDFYRRFPVPMAEWAAMPSVVTLTTTNYARLRSPDSYPRFQQVLQHISWAPVIVEFSWK
jgi:hypothetical protein